MPKSTGRLIAIVALFAAAAAMAAPSPRELTRHIRQELLDRSGAKAFGRPRAGAGPREVTANQVVDLLQGGDHVYLPIGHMASPAFAKALTQRAEQGAFSPDKPITIVGMSNTVSPKLFPRDGTVRVLSPFLGPVYRDAVSRGHGDFVPADYSHLPALYRNRDIPIDVAVHMVSPPDKDGYATLGTSVGEGLAALQAARLRVAEINPKVPRTFGASRVHLSHFDLVLHGADALKVLPDDPASEADLAIAAHVSRLVPAGATVQFGIGAIAQVTARALARTGNTYSVWSQLLSDGIVEMVNAGAVRGPVYYTFAMGSQRLLDALDGNRRYFGLPVDVLNNEQLLLRIPGLVATNGALEVDLFGNANGHKLGREVFSGIGGQLNFMGPASQSPGGRAIIGLRSTAEVNGESISRIVPRLVGGAVTTSLQRVTHVVTEHGVADLRGKGEADRAAALIGVAHPSFRERLTAALGEEMGARRALERTRYDKFLKRKGERQ